MSNSIGAPRLTGKVSKNKKSSWRKASEIGDILDGLDVRRAKEQTIGGHVSDKKDEELFVVDTVGQSGAQAPTVSPPKKLLHYQKVLLQRSSHPAVYSRPSSSAPPAKKKMTREQKERLLRIARKDIRGPFGALVERDPSRWGEGSALFGGLHPGEEYDWLAESKATNGEVDENAEWDEARTFVPKDIKVPRSLQSVEKISVPAIPLPPTGQSYNPTVEAHQALLTRAEEKELARVRKEEKDRIVKDRMHAARKTEGEMMGWTEDWVDGMRVDLPKDEEEEEEEDEEKLEAPKKKAPARKTKAERKKADKLAAEEAARLAQLKQKQLLQTINTLPTLRKQVEKTHSLRSQMMLQKAEARAARLQAGLKGIKVGKHVVPVGIEEDVQLGEDLSESWRAIKPEGNLFKDRFTSMQQRALVEPRKPIIPQSRARTQKTYEKHAWKNFERDM
ncbi:Cellular protein (glioma tumor suppressor candidate region gene 2) [Phaffia rhodozyma]|uniref:Ribosome biogenesis protein NOP53 n=1 Tax=Phaffia rhodozyma TaxID=264483 RepID=A0A0F7SPW4_PHARH|nr:Cellular protein (glioma tumor suppressor candidate region gene 2) [Phaffia rhodozyma]